jgi:hypothetical protein
MKSVLILYSRLYLRRRNNLFSSSFLYAFPVSLIYNICPDSLPFFGLIAIITFGVEYTL